MYVHFRAYTTELHAGQNGRNSIKVTIRHKIDCTSIGMQSHGTRNSIPFAEHATSLSPWNRNICPTPLYRTLLRKGNMTFSVKPPTPHASSTKRVFDSFGWRATYNLQTAITDKFRMWAKGGHYHFLARKVGWCVYSTVTCPGGRHRPFRYCTVWGYPVVEFARFLPFPSASLDGLVHKNEQLTLCVQLNCPSTPQDWLFHHRYNRSIHGHFSWMPLCSVLFSRTALVTFILLSSEHDPWKNCRNKTDNVLQHYECITIPIISLSAFVLPNICIFPFGTFTSISSAHSKSCSRKALTWLLVYILQHLYICFP